MTLSTLPPSARFKLEMMFHGIRYSAALGKAFVRVDVRAMAVTY